MKLELSCICCQLAFEPMDALKTVKLSQIALEDYNRNLLHHIVNERFPGMMCLTDNVQAFCYTES